MATGEARAGGVPGCEHAPRRTAAASARSRHRVYFYTISYPPVLALYLFHPMHPVVLSALEGEL